MIPARNYRDITSREASRVYTADNIPKDGMVDLSSSRCLHNRCMKQPSFNFSGNRAIYCKQHAEDDMIDVRSQRCLHESCMTAPNFNFVGKKQAYCKKHAEDGMVDVRPSRSKCLPNNSSMVVGAGRRLLTDGVPTDDVPTVGIRIKKEIADDPVTMRVGALCGVPGCLKRLRGGVDGKQVIHCLDHAPLDDGRVVHTAFAKTAHTKRGSRSPSSLGSRKHRIDGGGSETAVKRTRHRLYRREFPR